ncbi:TonB-dependent receptor plug domain-containing protein [Caulobacter ginsengisoli]|uniref:TonB-dependent receptor plug domain-containing protein n=1 Tax=Caulobacter ginsengisoli TaxID=400775 RepID=UPI0027D87275|nr:TonB-dependent receptor [Caulobacter ginsengisoli]
MTLAAVSPEAAAAPPPVVQGVEPYPAAFFASASPSTAMDMLDRVPGFAFDGGSGVRGFGGAAGNVLIDGERPTSKTDDLESILKRIPAGQVERIDLIRGGAPGIDMQGKTVIANVVRKKGTSTSGVFVLVDGSIYDGRQTPGIRFEGTRRTNDTLLEGSFVIASYLDDGAGDGPYSLRNTSGTVLEEAKLNTEGDGTQAVATGAYAFPLAGGRFRANARLMNDRFFYGERDNFIPGPAFATDREGEDKWQGELGADWTRETGPRTKVHALFLQQWKTDDYAAAFNQAPDSVTFSNNRKIGESVGRATLNFRMSDNLSFETGGEGAFNWLESETSLIVNGGAVTLPAANVRVEETRGELFGTATWKPFATLTIETGLRFETSKISSSGDVTLEKTLQFAKPRLLATWSPDPKDQIRFRLEREVGQLDFGDFVASSSLNTGVITAGNPDLNPQQNWVVELAYERRFWDTGSVTITLRHFKYTDVIDSKPIYPSGGGAPFDAPGNIGDGFRDAALVNFTLPLDRLGLKGAQLKGDGSIRRSEVTDPTTGATRRVAGEHPVDWNLTFIQDVPSHHLKWGVDAFGGWREKYYRLDQIETVKLRTFVVPFIEWKPRPDLMLRVELQNATSRDLAKYQFNYTGPRNTNPLDTLASRRYENGPIVYMKLRKTFG